MRWCRLKSSNFKSLIGKKKKDKKNWIFFFVHSVGGGLLYVTTITCGFQIRSIHNSLISIFFQAKESRQMR